MGDGVPKPSRNRTIPRFPRFSHVKSATKFGSTNMNADTDGLFIGEAFSSPRVVLSGGMLGPVINEIRSFFDSLHRADKFLRLFPSCSGRAGDI